jgi:chemotaxis protein histidine kinase CheA
LESYELKTEQVREMFRIFHSIKDSAGSYGLDTLTTICHQFEDFIGRLALDPEKEEYKEMVIQYSDVLEECVEDYIKDKLSNMAKYIDILTDYNCSLQMGSFCFRLISLIDSHSY